jgi:hypothetical protein
VLSPERDSQKSEKKKKLTRTAISPPAPEIDVDMTDVKPRKQPLTESQKEKRREQQRNGLNPTWNRAEVVQPTLTTQEITDELWGGQCFYLKLIFVWVRFDL